MHSALTMPLNSVALLVSPPFLFHFLQLKLLFILERHFVQWFQVQSLEFGCLALERVAWFASCMALSK